MEELECICSRRQYGGLPPPPKNPKKHNNIELTCVAAFQFPGVFPKQLEAGTQISVCTSVFMRAVTVAKRW